MEVAQIPAAVDEIDALMDAMSALTDSVVASSPDKFAESPPKKRPRRASPDSQSARDVDILEDMREMVQEVLDYYNSNHKDANYEYVTIVSQCPYSGGRRHGTGVHMNFFARQKDSDSSPELFYADEFCDGSEEEIECCILNPSPICFDEFVFPSYGVGISVYHPPNVKCVDCERMAYVMDNYEFDSDDDGIDMF